MQASSSESFEDAVRIAIERAHRTLRNVTAGWVKEQRVEVEAGRIGAGQVSLLVTFVLED